MVKGLGAEERMNGFLHLVFLGSLSAKAIDVEENNVPFCQWKYNYDIVGP
jgi:hypothetical protein